MYVVSVNVGHEQPIAQAKPSGRTGIFKEPAAGLVYVGPEGLAGDTIVDRKHHGGPDQAVYIYGTDDYAWWVAELGRELPPGTFGENLTIAGLVSADVAVGDRLSIGPVVLEITAPRLPCVTLAARMGDREFLRRFRDAGRPGMYCRVLVSGTVAAGQAVTIEPYEGDRITLGEMFAMEHAALGEPALRRLLAAPIAERARRDHEADLAKLLAARGTPAARP